MTSFMGAGGVSAVAGGAQGNLPQWNGIYYGAVSNNADPLKQNRCLLRIPQILGGAVTTWAVSLTPQQQVPAVGSLVVATFLGGDLNYPAYYVVNPQLPVETSAANIKPVARTAGAGTSTKYAAADHVHGTINATNATVSTITQGATASAGSSLQVAAADHVHAMGTLSYLPAGANGALQILSSGVNGLDNQAEIDLESQGFAGQTTADIIAQQTTVSGNLTILGSNFTTNSVNLSPPMATPPNFPLNESVATDSNSGTGWVSGERAFMNSNWVTALDQLAECLNSVIYSLINRGLMNP